MIQERVGYDESTIDHLTESCFEIKESWLIDTKRLILAGKLTLKEAAKHVEVMCISFPEVTKTRTYSPKYLSRVFQQHGIQLFAVGRNGYSKPLTEEEEIDRVTNVRANLGCGIRKTYEVLNKNGFHISHDRVKKVFQELLLIPKKPKKVQKDIRCRYLISQVNGVWHGDIHYIVLNNGDIHYLFALIDDRSRYIIHWGLFEHKTTENVRNVFEEAISKNNTTPLAFWSDNGLENCGRIMEQFLSKLFLEIHKATEKLKSGGIHYK